MYIINTCRKDNISNKDTEGHGYLYSSPLEQKQKQATKPHEREEMYLIHTQRNNLQSRKRKISHFKHQFLHIY